METGALIRSGGGTQVYGLASGDVIAEGGRALVLAGGVLSASTVEDGGELFLQDGLAM